MEDDGRGSLGGIHRFGVRMKVGSMTGCSIMSYQLGTTRRRRQGAS